ncbi:hypothetical protein G6F50_018341 [Rhizopus delemar]|uniref:Uncharacterized protein n=1 Tax=Rhizopus delemar TaxID=936053 RepID=A0A9P6XN43_9FUNG|nr:hypothetical protein G6F50_018341 [Rhizopus delemar]
MLRPAQPVPQHTKTALPRPLAAPPGSRQPWFAPTSPGSRQPWLALRVSTKVDTYRAARRRRQRVPGNAWRSSSTSTRSFSE